MKRTLPVVALIGFLVWTGVYVFIYLFRSFRAENLVPGEVVQIWHGDPFARAILVSLFFLIGLLVLLYVALSRGTGSRGGQVRLRPDLWQWLVLQSEAAGEPPERIAERAVAAYRSRLEGAATR